jgi:hypothetical protein
MDTFAPEFSRFWIPSHERDADARPDAADDETRRMQKALEELVERVSAARSIV